MRSLPITDMPEYYRDRLLQCFDEDTEYGICIEREHRLKFERVSLLRVRGTAFATWTSKAGIIREKTISEKTFVELWEPLDSANLPKECVLLTDLDICDGVSFLVQTLDSKGTSRLLLSGVKNAYSEAGTRRIADRVRTAFKDVRRLVRPWWHLFGK